MRFNRVIAMQKKMGVEYVGPPRDLPDDEFDFRIGALREEIQEIIDARNEGSIEKAIDGYGDLITFAMGALAQHGVDGEELFDRIMDANMFKDAVESADQSKRGYGKDLIKPEGWKEPYLSDLLIEPQMHRGLIILEGADACGKTTLAEHFEQYYGAVTFHSTWTPGLEQRMYEYMKQTLQQALQISKKRLVILDRHFLSALVYSDVFRADTTPNRDDMYFHFDVEVAQPHSCIVFCVPKDLEAQSKHYALTQNSREEMYPNVDAVNRAYQQLWDGSGDYQFKKPSQYHHAVLSNGGFSTLRMCRRYDWTEHTDTAKLDNFCHSILKNM